MGLNNDDYMELNFSSGGSGIDTRGWTPSKVKEVAEELDKNDGELRFNSKDIRDFLNAGGSQDVGHYLWGLRQVLHISAAVKRSNKKTENVKDILQNKYGITMDQLVDDTKDWEVITRKAPNGDRVGIIKKSDQLNFSHQKSSSYEDCPCSDFETKKTNFFAPKGHYGD